TGRSLEDISPEGIQLQAEHRRKVIKAFDLSTLKTPNLTGTNFLIKQLKALADRISDEQHSRLVESG
ncbi:hypothetical protein BGZ58_006245, partial [Dissophora ornata]